MARAYGSSRDLAPTSAQRRRFRQFFGPSRLFLRPHMTKTPEAPRSRPKQINGRPSEIDGLPPAPCSRVATKRECAEFFDVSIPAVDAWIRRGMPYLMAGSKTVPWEIDLLEVAKWRFNWRNADGSADPDSMEPAMRKAWYEGETKKRNLHDRERGLIPAAEVERDVAAVHAVILANLQAIPERLIRRGIPGDVAGHVADSLRDAVDAMEERLSKLAPV